MKITKTKTMTLSAVLVLFASCALGQPVALGNARIDLNRSFVNQPIPTWENGFFIGIGSEPLAAPPVYAYDGNGVKLFEVPLRLDNVARIMPGALAASSDGMFAVAGSAYSSDGYGIVFIAMIDQTGQITRVIRTGKFAPLRLSFTSDGTLWAAGRAVTYPSSDEAPDHHIIQAYNRDGSLRFSRVAVSTFPKDPSKSHPVRISHLSSNGEHVVLFSVEYNELIVISKDGTVLDRSRLSPPAPDYRVTGFAIAPDSSIYMSCLLPRADKKNADVLFYRRDTANSRWQPIYSRPLIGSAGHYSIYGASREGLLVSTKPPRFEWVTMTKLLNE